MVGIDKYLQRHYSPDTVKAYKREITIYVNSYAQGNPQNLEPQKATYKDIMAYMGVLRKRYRKAATLHRLLSSIKVYYAYLCDAGIRSDNPAKSIQLKDTRTRDIQLQDLFNSEELEQLLERQERYVQLDYRNKVLISLFIYQALLPAEAEAINVEEVNLNAGTIYIKATYKTNRRTLSLKPSQILLFYHYITVVRPALLKGNNSTALLLGIRGEPMSGEDITKHIKRSFKGLYPPRKINAQTIRQSVITNLLKQGIDISLVQAFAGHKYPTATERYQQTEIETLRSAINKYHPQR